ncbi:MAG: hypothetical protein IV094_01820 [Vitreoscilla sp.]|nr:hypothetical protein [Vitreoscilla sp.]
MSRARSIRQRWWAAWLAGLSLALLLGSSLGAWHRIRHLAGPTTVSVDSHRLSASDVLGHRAGSGECALFDEGLLGSGPTTTPLVVAAHEPPAIRLTGSPVRVPLGTGQWRAQARGPPAHSA